MSEAAARKVASLQRCVARARDTRQRAGENFATNYDLQDAAILNVIRACDTAIDLANMVIRQRKLGIPGESRDSFAILAREGLLEHGLGDAMEHMVGFRNIAVHQYRKLDMAIVDAVISRNLDELLAFAAAIWPLLSDEA